MHHTFYLIFFFQDIRYADYKELIIKKKLITKPQTTVITEGEKKGKVLHTYNYLHFTIIYVTDKKQLRNCRKVAYFTNS